MLASRVIPCLLLMDGGLYKTVKFRDPRYLGDPLNAVRLFNEKLADELVIFDISKNRHGRGPDFSLLGKLASESRMPLCYGGGISSLQDIERLVSLGIEKVSLSSVAISNPKIIEQAISVFGSQSIVVTIDVKRKGWLRTYEVSAANASVDTGLCPVDFASRLEQLGVGELIINNVDMDGLMAGYDFTLVRNIYEQANIPLAVVGGAGSLDDVSRLVDEFPFIGACAGSLFVYKGKHKAVLINYPSPEQKNLVLKVRAE